MAGHSRCRAGRWRRRCSGCGRILPEATVQATPQARRHREQQGLWRPGEMPGARVISGQRPCWPRREMTPGAMVLCCCRTMSRGRATVPVRGLRIALRTARPLGRRTCPVLAGIGRRFRGTDAPFLGPAPPFRGPAPLFRDPAPSFRDPEPVCLDPDPPFLDPAPAFPERTRRSSARSLRSSEIWRRSPANRRRSSGSPLRASANWLRSSANRVRSLARRRRSATRTLRSPARRHRFTVRTRCCPVKRPGRLGPKGPCLPDLRRPRLIFWRGALTDPCAQGRCRWG
jgi:hypothetical protein